MNQQTKEKLFEELKKRKISRVILHYSGGNDEGGVDSIEAFNNQGKNVSAIISNWLSNMESKLSEPIDDAYGSFCGDFYADGTLTWDVKNNKVIMSGQESETVWNSIDEEL